MKKGTSKTDGLKITYTYVEPKDEAEKAEQERKISAAYAILFEATEKRMKEKDAMDQDPTE